MEASASSSLAFPFQFPLFESFLILYYFRRTNSIRCSSSRSMGSLCEPCPLAHRTPLSLPGPFPLPFFFQRFFVVDIVRSLRRCSIFLFVVIIGKVKYILLVTMNTVNLDDSVKSGLPRSSKVGLFQLIICGVFFSWSPPLPPASPPPYRAYV